MVWRCNRRGEKTATRSREKNGSLGVKIRYEHRLATDDWALNNQQISNGLLIECWSMIQMINIGDDRSITGCCVNPPAVIYIYTHWLVVGTFFIFPFSWECNNPNWLIIIFQRGRSTTNQFFFLYSFSTGWSGGFNWLGPWEFMTKTKPSLSW